MPYRRRTYRRRTRRNRGSRLSLYRRLRSVEKKQFNSSELKYFCREFGTTSVSSAGSGAWDLNLIPQGDGEGQRIGDSVNPKAAVLRWRLLMADATQSVRVIIARVYGRTGDLALSDFPIGGTAGTEPLGCYDRKHMKYKVLLDKLYTGTNASGNSTSVISRTFVFRKLGGKIRWDTDTPADTERGGFVMFMVSDSLASTHPTVHATWQLSFTDQ